MLFPFTAWPKRDRLPHRRRQGSILPLDRAPQNLVQLKFVEMVVVTEVDLRRALAGAAATTQEPRTIAALISVFVIRTVGSRFCNPTADRFGFAIDIVTLLLASEGFLVFRCRR